MTRSLRLGGLAIAVAVVGGGACSWAGQRIDPPTPTSSDSSVSTSAPPRPASSPAGSSPAAEADVVKGWPSSTARNSPGLYSWGGNLRRCEGESCVYGFMHNGRGPGKVAITIRELSEKPYAAEATFDLIAGHIGLHRQLFETEPEFVGGDTLEVDEWIIEIDGAVVQIRLEVNSGASASELAEARAILDSMRYEPARLDPGFRFVFRIMTFDWDSA